MSNQPMPWSDSVQQQAHAQLQQGLQAMNIELSTDRQQRLIEYLMLMSRWNRAYNLTAVREPLAMVERHLLDSLSIAQWVEGATVLDAGTGAGLPGIPLAIADSSRQFMLADSNGKKIRFVREAVRQLGLNHVEPLQTRLEALDEASLGSAPEKLDIVCRALAPLAQLIEWSDEWLAKGARLLAMKAELSDAERNAVPEAYNVEIVLTARHEQEEHRRQRCLAIITRT